MQIFDPMFDVLQVIMPHLAIDPRRSKLLEFEEARREEFYREVTKQIVKSKILILLCRFSYAKQSARSGAGRRGTGRRDRW